MKNKIWMAALAALTLFTPLAQAQQFRILDYDGENITVEYPPSFDGAYLFINQSTNLSDNAWDTLSYTQLQTVVSASSDRLVNMAWEIQQEVDSGFCRFSGLSFIDSDGDGVDNLTEYARNTDPYTSDAPPVSLPLDNGDPQPVPGSVDSAPGDWNTPPQNLYRATGSPYEAINMRILAMDGTNGTFTAQTPVVTLGGWIEAQCGAWVAPAGEDLYPTVSGGRFYRTVTNGFHWAGKENIFPLALHPYDGSEDFINHLVQSDPADPSGLAFLPHGSPVLVNASNPWTTEKLKACLEHLITVECRLQRVLDDAFDPSDTTAMAQSQQQWKSEMITRELTPTDAFWRVIKIAKWDWEYVNYQWLLQTSSTWYSRAQKFTFSNNLQNYGFGQTTHRGFIGITAETDWTEQGTKYSWQTNMPPHIFPDAMSEVFVRSDNETCWFMADAVNYANTPNEKGNYAYGYGTFVSHKTGYDSFAYTVLSTLSPPVAPPSTLVMDFDRDGTIGSNDWSRIDESHPFRFWVNGDGNAAAYPEADLEDFFPVQIMWQENMPNLTFKLSANVDLDYIPTSMITNNTDAYLTELDVAADLSQPSQIHSLSSGTQTGTAFAENTILLLAASAVNTNAEIYVHTLESGTEIAVSTNYFSFSPVADMYRTKNLRFGGSSTTNEPTNWPDNLTNGKDLVYVHGFNVDEESAENWHRNIFKRLWHAGSNAKYHGVIWDGMGQGSILTHFHNSVVNAFATAPWLAEYLKSSTISASETVVLGHSLGNMVVSSAISEYNAPVTQYYALDAAVALEAYGDVTNHAAFVPDVVFTWEKAGFLNYKRQGWLDYPFETWAAEWYRLFPESDPRSKLTFRHKFADIQQKTDVFNFYSSTEDVLRVRDDVNGILDSITDVDIELFMHIIPTDLNIESQCAWQLQEMYKGMNNWALEYGGGGSSKYTGWAFTEYDGRHQIDKKVKRPGSHPPTYIYTKYSESGHAAASALSTNAANATVRAEYLENLKIDPLFNRTPWQLFDTGAEAFAGGIVGDYEAVLDYDNSEQYGAPDLDVSQVKVSDWLLAKGFPSRTGPMGSAENKLPLWLNHSYDMSDSTDGFMTNPGQWFHDKTYNGQPVWRHSDWKNAPYVHVYKLFKKITKKED